jgi:DNA-binding HxlR family transcriptional regulator
MYKRKIPIELNCGLDLVKEVLYGKWKIHLVYFISQGIKRPGELQKKIPGATRRVLNVQLNLSNNMSSFPRESMLSCRPGLNTH